ncbi:MAG: SPOR domain-containing protein [Bacteroidales bacterium]|jgi:hypothetical protein|nr:SPOR domain-containing protein [Bacteroidales bacterium]
MKRGVFLLGMLLSMTLVIAQDFYTIQVRSLSRETPLTMEELQVGMWQHKVGGQTKCFMGRFDTYDEAKAALIPLKVGKYSGAFVLSSDKIFSTTTTGEELIPATATEVDTAEKIIPKETLPKPVVVSTIKTYTIQIAAYRYPLYTKEFNLENEVMEFYCSDNIYRYTVGKFEEESKARDRLKKVRESGYPDAFLIDYKKYEVYRIE